MLAGLVALALAVRWKLQTESNRSLRLVYLMIIIVATTVTLYSGHLGGRLVHG